MPCFDHTSQGTRTIAITLIWSEIMFKENIVLFKYKNSVLFFLIPCLILSAACVSNTRPQTTHDGLVLVPDTKFSAVYKKPNAQLSEYKKFAIVTCQVVFKKNWLKDQNYNRNLSQRISQKDVDRIKKALSTECDKHFKEVLLQEPSYPLTNTIDKDKPVLILRPSIINLEINAPDVLSPGRTRTYTTSAGEMTLFLELIDNRTGDILARVVDKRRGLDSGRMQWTNSITNRAEAERILGNWARLLRKGLDAVYE